MTNSKPLFRKAGKIEIGILIVTILPIILISLFNHPLGDDYWFSALTRQQGFVHAFSTIYNTVSARYTALSLMGISPLVFGNFSLFKLLPLLYILSLATATFYLINSTIDRSKSNLSIRKDAGLVSAVFTITYLAVMPGIGEGLFWTSSLVVYQFSIIGFIIWLTGLIRWHFQKIRSLRNLLASSLCFVLIIGCNEIVGGIVCLINLFITVYLLLKQRKFDPLSATMLVLMIPCWYFIIDAPSFAIRYGMVFASDVNGWMSLLIKAMKYSGYHIVKCLINPFLLIGIIISAKSLININKVIIIKSSVATGKLKLFAIAWISLIVGIELVAIILTDNHIPPLRVTNIAVYFLLSGLLAFGVIWIHLLSGHFRLTFLNKFITPILLLLLITGFLSYNNISTASKELISKEAYLYDKEMNFRYAVISNSKSDTCFVPSLKHRPQTLRYSYFDNDDHIGEYFQKVILYKE